MPKVCVEEVPENLLIRKREPRKPKVNWVPFKLRQDVREWMQDNLTSHWFISNQKIMYHEGKGPRSRRHNVKIIINFTCEFDATAWKLVWL